MLKFAFFLIIVLCGVGIGIELRQHILYRTHSLEMFRDIFSYIESEIVYSRKTLHDIIKEYYQLHKENEYLSLCCNEIQKKSFSSAWTTSIHAMAPKLYLLDEDIRFLDHASERLGKSDIECEKENLEFIISELNKMIVKSKEKLAIDGKIYLTTGSSIGIIIALLII